MDVTVKKLPKSQVEISVSLPWDEWKGEMDHAAEHLAQEVKMPGFRPGKVPRDVLEKRYGKGMVLAEAAEHAVSHSYPKVLDQEKIDAIGHPEVTLGNVAEGELLGYTVVTAVMPEVALGSWKDAVKKVNKEYTSKEEGVEESDIAAELERLSKMRAPLVTVDREARLGDNVLVDFTVLRDGVAIENGTSKKHPLTLGSGVFIPGFEEQLVGMKTGEEKSFELSFPAEYHATDLAGKPATFSVKMGEVQEAQVPELNDDFAKSIGAFETLEALKTSIKVGMLEEKKMKKKEEWRTALLDTLAEKSEIDFPEVLVNEELDRMLREFEGQVRSIGTDLPGYLEKTGKSEEDLRAEWQPQAKKRLAAHLVLGRLATDEDIRVETSEIEEEMNKALQYYKNIKDIGKEIDMERLYTAVSGQLRNEKVFEFLEKL